MAVKIRLARGGAKKRPFYSIVVADVRSPRDGRFIEKLGTYNPMLADGHDQKLVVKADRVQHWLGHGALPTDRVAKLLSKLDLVAAPKINEQPKKSAPKAAAQERLKERAEKEATRAEAEAAAKAEAEAAAAAPAEEPAVEEAAAEQAPAEAEAEAESETETA